MIQEIINRFPGISCAFIDTAGNEKTEYYGVSDKETNSPVDENTLFPSFSMSKLITALCLIKLHEEGVIDIYAPVNNYLHRWKLMTVSGIESEATVKSLLCHTSGIIDAENSFYGIRRGDAEIGLTDILAGSTFYNNRPVQTERSPGIFFEYSDAGYCVLQLLVEESTNMPFADAVKAIVLDKLQLKRTFYSSERFFEDFGRVNALATGYDSDGIAIRGSFLPCPDLAGSGLWSTPKELIKIAKELVSAYNGKSSFLNEKSAREIAGPAEGFPWAGLGVFILGADTLMTQGWGESGQCMMKINYRTGQASVVMTNRNPDMDQSESGVEWLVNKNFI